MKKFLGLALCLAALLYTVPLSVSAATSTDGTIDMHGAKTYIGATSAWSTTWNPDNFEEVTNADADWDGNLTIKSGSVKNVTVSGSSATVTVTAGTIGSIDADGDVKLNGGTIKNDVEAGGTVTFGGAVTVKGDCIAQNITATGSTTATAGSLNADGTITLDGIGVKTGKIVGNSSATLVLKSYTLALPAIEEMGTINLTGDATVTGAVDTNTLSIPSKKQFTAKSTVEVGTLQGPGTLAFYSGKLTIDNGVTGKPMISFLNSVHNGSLAFKASPGKVDEEDLLLYDFSLESDTSGGNEEFYLTDSIKEGITLSESSVSVSSKYPAEIKAYVNPSLTKFATGTKIVWELHGDTTAFSISPDSTKNTCKISLNSSQTGSHDATLTAYLVDQRGDRLADYKSGNCRISVGDGSPAVSGLTLDTSTVTIPKGGTYWVLAITDSATAPIQMSYNSAIATVGAAKAYNEGGKAGWLYPVNGISKGQVTIDIGGQKMITNVAGGSIIVDTSSYTMSPGASYCIGVRMYGLDRKQLNVHSGNSCTTIQYKGNVKGLDLYVIKAEQAGTGYAIFDINGGQSVRTQINIEQGAAPHGISARLIAAG